MTVSVWGSLSALSGPFGKVTLAAGATSGNLTDFRITANSIILTQLESIDTTCTRIIVVPGAGVAVFTPNAAPTADVVISYVIVNPNANI
jgi:hypothetical protein